MSEITREDLLQISAKVIKEKYEYDRDDKANEAANEIIRVASQVAADVVYEYHLKINNLK